MRHSFYTHKGQVFRYASEFDILAYEILQGLAVKGGGAKENDN